MKEEKVISEIRFVCDNCSKKIDRSAIQEKQKIFPYEEGWVYLYDLNLQLFGNVERTKRIELQDKHFCCATCMLSAIANALGNGK